MKGTMRLNRDSPIFSLRLPLWGSLRCLSASTRPGKALPFLFFLSACGTQQPPEPLVEARDSAGILIVENRHTPSDLPTFATVDSEPLLELGVMAGDPHQEFGSVPFAARLGKDRILVADGQARELRIFDLGKTHLATVGGRGEGPGEFQAFGALAVTPGDSIRVWDPRNRRITVLGPHGELSSETLLDGALARRISSPAFLPDGSILAHVRAETEGFREFTRATLVRDSITLHVTGPTGEPLGTLGTFPGSEAIVRTQVSPRGEGAIVTSSHASPSFPRTTHRAAGKELVFVGDNASFRIHVLDLEGNTRMQILCPGLERPLLTRDVTLMKALAMETVRGSAEGRRQVASFFEDFPHPDLWPAFSRLLVDKEGFLWVREYGPDPEQGTVWFVFRPTGELAGKAVLPPGSTVYEIGEDYIVLRPPHELDVATVRIHRIRRGP
jgi:hypothetical protein